MGVDNWNELNNMSGNEREKLIRKSCRNLKKFGCKVVEVYVNMFNHVSTITFIYKKEQHQIMAFNVKDTWDETKLEVPSILILEIKNK